jgi:hypothetical protein
MIENARRKPAESAGGVASRDAVPFRVAPHNIEAEQALLDDFLLGKEVVVGKAKFTAAITAWIVNPRPEGMQHEELALTHCARACAREACRRT